ncbi:glycosyltransferase family 4 protein [Mucilaginibacter sp. UYCu711]|uniref:glycosyltransferase family 4 protein n=1 Tax=Mucilaginibacter sp. UYCu711 TaxID=3156339 RepID=UPI003D1B41DE
MNTKVLFIVPYPFDKAPSQRLKFEQYYSAFKNSGLSIAYEPFINEDFWAIVYKKGYYFSKLYYTVQAWIKRYMLLATIRKYDVVYLHLWGTPFGFPVYEWLLRKYSKKLVYDIDDLIYKAASSPNNWYLSILKSSLKVDFLMKHADHVLVSTDKLFDYSRKINNQVTLIPATIDVEKYIIPDKKSDVVNIGWSGSHTTSKYVHLLDNVLKKVVAAHNVKIMIMGDDTFSIDGVDVQLLKWTPESEIPNMNLFDIGIHPLPDEEWVYGKSGGKLVQYMAAGIPIIASAIGPNLKVIENGYNGFLVGTEDEWIKKLELLITNEVLRKQMGINSRKHAETFFSVEANLKHYLDTFNSLIK